MSLLPRSHQDFKEKDYWNTFFSKRGKQAFEWYGEYAELCGELHKYIKPQEDILIIGCGNSNLSMDLYDVGYRNITNIDISKVVIRQMLDLNHEQRPDMKFIQMDVMNTTFHDEQFNVILDKGTLDALMPNDDAETIAQIDKMFYEINRTLKNGGRYICISLLQEHILRHLLHFFPKNNYVFRIVRCHDAERKTAENGDNSLPVFAVVCTKFKIPINILETCFAGDKMTRYSTSEELTSALLAIQKAAMVCSGLNKNSITGEEVSLDLFKPDETTPRFTVYILDQVFDRKSGQYAAFIVPQGRETEWLFSTKEGRKKLLKSANFNRLAIITMHRNQMYDSLEAVKEELKTTVLNLAPVNTGKIIPYLSLGDDVGKRIIRYQGKSNFSGDFIVEDVFTENNDVYRRLIFLNNRNVVQSEAKLINVKQRTVPHPSYLACSHHLYMTVGIKSNLPPNSKKSSFNDVLLIGLGGGGLCTFLNSILKSLSTTAVEIDASLVEVAKDYFGLDTKNRKLKIVVDDGLNFLEKAAKEDLKYMNILFDVDSKDSSVGMSCPPKEFLEESILKSVISCLDKQGLFILNLVLRDETLRDPIIKKIQKHFKSILSYKLDEDLNEILFCKVGQEDGQLWKNRIENAAIELNILTRNTKSRTDDIIDLVSLTESLKLYERNVHK